MPLKLDTRKTYSETQIEEALSSGRCNLTAGKLAAVNTTTKRTALHVAAEKGLLNKIAGGVTADDLCISADSSGIYPLFIAGKYGHLRQIIEGANLRQLANCQNMGDVETALEATVVAGHANQITCNESASDLSAASETFSETPPLHEVARLGLFHLVKGGVTIAQLTACKKDDEGTALHQAARYGHLDKLPKVTSGFLASVKDTGDFSALDSAATGRNLDQVTGGVTATALANSRDNVFGATALHRAASHGALHQVDGLDMDILIKTVDAAGRSAMGYALEYMKPEDFKIIPGFRSQDLPKSVILNKSVLNDGYCVLQYLLTSKTLPKDFICSEWLDWASEKEQEVWNLKNISQAQANCFIRNVDPVFMSKYQTGAKYVVEFAGDRITAGAWFAKVIEANQQQKLASAHSSR